MSNIASTIAISLGAVAIEKHFKPSEDAIGPDSSFSIIPNQLNLLVNDWNNAWQNLGKSGLQRSSAEENWRKHRRSIFFIKNLKKRDIIKSKDVKVICPEFGISPKYIKSIIGKHIDRNVERADPVLFDFFNEKIEKK